jgi:phytoene synthase
MTSGLLDEPPDYFGGTSGADWNAAVHSSTFKPALLLFPSGIRSNANRLYHVLRVLDDLVDERRPDAPQRIGAVEAWCRDGAVDSPEARVFADLAGRCGLTPEPVADFCQGMRHDLARAPIDTQAQLDLYCRRAGGGPGVMFAQLAGTPHLSVEQKMTALGMAAQLTNILRDIDEDLDHGRSYIPRETIERFGSIAPGKREPLLRHEIARADAWYDEGMSAIPLLHEGKRAIAAGATLYREILRQIEREGYGARPGRVVVPAWRRRIILAKARPASSPRIP